MNVILTRTRVIEERIVVPNISASDPKDAIALALHRAQILEWKCIKTLETGEIVVEVKNLNKKE